MPETSMNEDDSLPLGEHDIRSARANQVRAALSPPSSLVGSDLARRKRLGAKVRLLWPPPALHGSGFFATRATVTAGAAGLD
jgi:hypothetical protein